MSGMEEYYEKTRKEQPGFYKHLVDRYGVIDPLKQRRLQKYGIEKMFDYMHDWKTASGLDIYPRYESKAMRELEKEIVECIRNMPKDAVNLNFKKLHKKYGDRVIRPIGYIDRELYTTAPTQRGDSFDQGDLEYKVKSVKRIPGQKFFPIRVKGYYGCLHYWNEEVAAIAPKDANAYKIGGAWGFDIDREKTVDSILIADKKLGPVYQPADEYQLTTIKFYKIEADTSGKYEWEMINEGDHALYEFVKQK